MRSLIYMEMNVFAIAVLGVLLSNLRKSGGMTRDEVLFRRLVASVMMVLAADGFAWTLEGRSFPGAHLLLVTFDTAYFYLTGLVSFIWAQYIDCRLFPRDQSWRRRRYLYMIPYVFLSVVALLTPFTGWIFTIDSSNIYHRGGTMFYVHTLLSGFSTVFASCRALWLVRKNLAQVRKNETLLISLLSLLSFFSGVVQLDQENYPLLWIMTTIALLIVFVRLQNKQITLDTLTNINNRRTLNRYLDTAFINLKKDDALYLIIIDIDDFKSINDTLGHAVGDAAIIQTAEILKRVCGRGGYFLARYGGDEFVVATVRHHGSDMDDVIAQIHAEVALSNDSSNQPYKLSFSMGHAHLHAGDPRGVEGLIREADRWMYTKKRSGKKAAAEKSKTDGTPNGKTSVSGTPNALDSANTADSTAKKCSLCQNPACEMNKPEEQEEE